jgi:hypothetical protein
VVEHIQAQVPEFNPVLEREREGERERERKGKERRGETIKIYAAKMCSTERRIRQFHNNS